MARRSGYAVLYARDRRYSADADAILDKAAFVVKQLPPLLFFNRFLVDMKAFYHTLPVVTQYGMV
jgi:hypothetical protein